MEGIDKIKNAVPEDELLCGLAEEAAELAQAALKYRRALTGSSPTPTTKTKAWKNLLEELADVELYFDALGYNDDAVLHKIRGIKKEKLARWIERLETAQNGQNG